jgi:hypothetical protein
VPRSRGRHRGVVRITRHLSGDVRVPPSQDRSRSSGRDVAVFVGKTTRRHILSSEARDMSLEARKGEEACLTCCRWRKLWQARDPTASWHDPRLMIRPTTISRPSRSLPLLQRRQSYHRCRDNFQCAMPPSRRHPSPEPSKSTVAGRYLENGRR